MGKRKLEKFAAINSFPNVVQNASFFHPQLVNYKSENIERKGRWKQDQFNNTNPIVLELACGKGEYTVDMAIAVPDKNFIGVDIKGNRIFVGAKRALSEKINNAAFLRTDINLIPHYFEKGEVGEIWITFPDPHLTPGKSQKRFTSEWFLNKYKCFLEPDGLIHLKTDDLSLYQFTLRTIKDTGAILLYADDDIYSKPLPHPFLEIKTYYEKMHLADGRKIKYVQFRLNENSDSNTVESVNQK